MKKSFIIAFLFLSVLSVRAVEPLRVEPSFWWTGMKNPELQLMICGPGIAGAEVAVDYPGVRVKEVAKEISPNYLFVYLEIAPEAQPGRMNLVFTQGKDSQVCPYELKPRSNKPGAMGFDSSDVLYLITPDRFANGDLANDTLCQTRVDRNRPNARHAGDLRGLIDRLDYIADLGVTTVWVNPVLENLQPGGSYHGYAITDFYRVDPRFGTNEEYCELVDAAHAKGMKVVMDMIFNHCGSQHPWMKDYPASDWLNHQKEGFVPSSHGLWSVPDLHAASSEIAAAADGWFTPGLPDLNQRNRHLAVYLIQNSLWWIEYARIDGIRQDTHPYADYDFMSRWCKAVEDEYPAFNIVGETWYSQSSAVAWWQRNSPLSHRQSYLKTVMDFGLTFTCQEVFAVEQPAAEKPLPGHFKGLGRLYELIAQDFLYADPDHLLIFLDNHDLSRFVKKDESDLNRYKQAFAFLLTTRGIPQLYYGTEILMEGEKEEGDGTIRKDFPGGWPGDPTDAFTRMGRTDRQNEAWDFLQRLLVWRRNSPAVTSGKLIHYAPDASGCYVYGRIKDDHRVLVILNGTDQSQTLSTSRFRDVLGGREAGTDVLTGQRLDLTGACTIPARGTLVLELL